MKVIVLARMIATVVVSSSSDSNSNNSNNSSSSNSSSDSNGSLNDCDEDEKHHAASWKASEDDWVTVWPRLGCCVVSVGECLALLTNNVLRTVLHRNMTVESREIDVLFLARPSSSTPMASSELLHFEFL